MKSIMMSVAIACLYSGAGCAVDSGPAAQVVTTSIQQHLVRGDNDLCSRWNQCYIGCAAMQCDDDATCAAQQAAYAACDEANAPAPDYCPLPG